MLVKFVYFLLAIVVVNLDYKSNYFSIKFHFKTRLISVNTLIFYTNFISISLPMIKSIINLSLFVFPIIYYFLTHFSYSTPSFMHI
jgi:hypothetical protein